MEFFGELEGAGRANFMAKGHNLYGSDLAKAMTEAIHQSRLCRQAAKFTSTGKFMDIEGDEGVNEKYKNKPDELASILDKGHRIVCPVRNVEQVWVPEHHLELGQGKSTKRAKNARLKLTQQSKDRRSQSLIRKTVMMHKMAKRVEAMVSQGQEALVKAVQVPVKFASP